MRSAYSIAGDYADEHEFRFRQLNTSDIDEPRREHLHVVVTVRDAGKQV